MTGLPFPGCVPELTDGVVRLRAHRPEDAERIVEQSTDAETMRWTTVPRPYDLDDARDFLAKIEREWATPGGLRHWAITDAADPSSRYLGTVDLRPRGGGAAETGFGLHPHGRGTVVQRIVAGSLHCSTIRSASSRRWARSRTTPSVSSGTQPGNGKPVMPPPNHLLGRRGTRAAVRRVGLFGCPPPVPWGAPRSTTLGRSGRATAM